MSELWTPEEKEMLLAWLRDPANEPMVVFLTKKVGEFSVWLREWRGPNVAAPPPTASVPRWPPKRADIESGSDCECNASCAGEHVYFMSSGSLVKIGYSTQPRSRYLSLRTGCPDLKTEMLMPGTREDERAFHRRFAEFREIGEWFRPEGALLEYMRSDDGRGWAWGV